MLGHIYQGYLIFLGWVGRLFHSTHSEVHVPEVVRHLSRSEGSLKELDRQATVLGNAYRGLGVLVGILGVLIISCALAPIGFELKQGPSHLVHWTEIGLMAITVAIFAYAKLSRMHERWVLVRSQAESRRYEELYEVIQSKDVNKIYQSLQKMLIGKDGQIEYNRRKQHQYESIEQTTSMLTWLTFLAALLAAFVHLFFDFPWLILLTANLPAVGGAVHGINGFLEISELESTHQEMFHSLSSSHDALAELIGSNSTLKSGTEKKVIALASNIYGVLTTQDKWIKTAKKQQLKPV